MIVQSNTKLLVSIFVSVIGLGFFCCTQSMNEQDEREESIEVSKKIMKELKRQDKRDQKEERNRTKSFLVLDAEKQIISEAGGVYFGEPDKIQGKSIFDLELFVSCGEDTDQDPIEHLKKAFRSAEKKNKMVKYKFYERWFDYFVKIHLIAGQQKTRWLVEVSKAQHFKRAEDGTILK